MYYTWESSYHSHYNSMYSAATNGYNGCCDSMGLLLKNVFKLIIIHYVLLIIQLYNNSNTYTAHIHASSARQSTKIHTRQDKKHFPHPMNAKHKRKTGIETSIEHETYRKPDN